MVDAERFNVVGYSSVKFNSISLPFSFSLHHSDFKSNKRFAMFPIILQLLMTMTKTSSKLLNTSSQNVQLSEPKFRSFTMLRINE